jgi:hypothetical protein
VTEELAGLVAMERTTASEDLHDEINKVLQQLNIPVGLPISLAKT